MEKVIGFESLVSSTMSAQIEVRGNASTVKETFGASDEDIDKYVTEVLAMYDQATTNDERLNVVMKEYYIAAWGNGLEAFNMYRRTGMPNNMQPGLEAEVGDFPRTFLLPSTHVTRNASVTQKSLTDKTFWDDGSTFGQANSSSTVYGAAFRGFFNFTMAAGCPSALDGTYSYEGSSFACPDGASSPTGTGTGDIVAKGGGLFYISDWSFGAYAACYGAGEVADSQTLTFTDVCNKVSFTGFTDDFGDTWTFESELSDDKKQWTIKWKNTFDEAGVGVIINEDGWPIEL